MAAIETLQDLIDHGFDVIAYCGNCRHYADLDLQALGERLGFDFVAIGEPQPLVAKLKCARCGGKDLSLRLSPEVNRRKVMSVGPTYGPGPREVPPIGRRRARRKAPI